MKRNSLALLFILFCLTQMNVLQAEKVTVTGRNIYINGIQYLIKGVCYHPVPIGSSDRNFSRLTGDLQLMKEAGINTIRVYSPVDDKSVLDRIHAAGLKIIISFGYNQGGFYDILSGSYINYIKKYKDHDAILLWELGNEYNYHPEWFDGDINNWYTAMNRAADIIHRNDPNHPVATAHGELPKEEVVAICPNIDVWGMNVYRWDDPEGIFKQWSAISSKPMYLSEAGADSYMTVTRDGYDFGENEKAQSDALSNILDDVLKYTGICSGVAVFAFVDEWWKAGDTQTQDPGGSAPNSSGVPFDGSPNEEYWGILDIHRNKKMAFDIVKAKFTDPSGQ